MIVFRKKKKEKKKKKRKTHWLQFTCPVGRYPTRFTPRWVYSSHVAVPRLVVGYVYVTFVTFYGYITTLHLPHTFIWYPGLHTHLYTPHTHTPPHTPGTTVYIGCHGFCRGYLRFQLPLRCTFAGWVTHTLRLHIHALRTLFTHCIFYTLPPHMHTRGPQFTAHYHARSYSVMFSLI